MPHACAYPKYAIASLSLGSYLHHSIPTKIIMASELGYDGIEIFFPDFEAFVSEVKVGKYADLFTNTPSFAPASLLQRDLERACAATISALCKAHDLSIPVIQPLRNFENFTSDEELSDELDAAERWLDLMPYFDTDLILVCSNYIEGPGPLASTTIASYLDAQVRAFRLLGQRAAKYSVKVGYEPLAWGTVVNRWDQVWDVVKRTDMLNIGVILDSFNTLGHQYADPSTENALRSVPFSDVTDSLALLARTIPGDKIFLYQVADAHRPAAPIPERPDAPARMTWSRASRLFPCEVPPADAGDEGYKYSGFLPVPEMTREVHVMGYCGWWSLEVFNISFFEADEGCPRRHGQWGIDGLRRLWDKTRAAEGIDGRVVTPPLQESGTGLDTEGESELESIDDVAQSANRDIVVCAEGGVPGKAAATWGSLERTAMKLFSYPFSTNKGGRPDWRACGI